MPLALSKVADFWLSTDQLFGTAAFHRRERILRASGVLVYWVFLALAVAGWFRLRSQIPGMARLFFCYAALVTVMHLPFVMNTRLRMPFTDGLLVVLSANGLLPLVAGNLAKNGTLLTNATAA